VSDGTIFDMASWLHNLHESSFGPVAEVISHTASAINLRIVSVTPLDARRSPTFNEQLIAIILGCIHRQSAQARDGQKR
jgi:hypothetical protein